MPAMDKNDAAERLAGEVMVACAEKRPMNDLLLRLRAAERRATVDEIREALANVDPDKKGVAINAILHKVAER